MAFVGLIRRMLARLDGAVQKAMHENCLDCTYDAVKAKMRAVAGPWRSWG